MEKKKILVVDDEVSFTRMLRRNLEATGKYEVREENSGANAYAAAREYQPALILLDVAMPEVDGGDVAAKIQEDVNMKQIPIVFLTALMKKEEQGPTGSVISGRTILAKPIQLNELVACIENELGK